MSNQVLGSDKILRLNDFTLLGLVQSEDWAPNFNAQDIMEMGNEAKVDTAMEIETSGSMEIESAGNLAGFLARWQVKRTAGTDAFAGWTYDAAGSSGKNGYTITHSDMEEMYADILVHERTLQDQFDRSVWLPRAFLTGFSGRIDSNGMGSESVNWAGQDAVVFPKPFHDIRSVAAIFTDVTTANLEDATIDSATHTLAYVYVNERRFRNGTTSDATTFEIGTGLTVGQLLVTTTEGFELKATDVIRALVVKTTGSTTFPVLATADRGTSARYIKAHQANIYLAPTLDGSGNPVLASSDLWLRAQSIDFNVDLRTEVLRQIMQNKVGTSVYCRVPTFPLDVSCNISVYETDLADWKKMTTKSGTGVYNESLDWSPETLKSSFAVVIEYFTKSGTKLQQIDFTDQRIDSAAMRASVGGRGEVSFGTKGTKFKITGLNA